MFALLSAAIAPHLRAATVKAAIGFLFSFDLFCRGMDMCSVLHSELRPPAPGQVGSASTWSVVFFPGHMTRSSKTRQKDVCKAVGATHPERAWLQSLCPLLRLKRKAKDTTLLQISTAFYVKTWHHSGQLAKMPRAVLH